MNTIRHANRLGECCVCTRKYQFVEVASLRSLQALGLYCSEHKHFKQWGSHLLPVSEYRAMLSKLNER